MRFFNILNGLLIGFAFCLWTGCTPKRAGTLALKESGEVGASKYKKYSTIRLTTDLSNLATHEQKIISLLIKAADEMDSIFWKQAYGDRQELFASIADDEMRRYADINYGPWDCLDGDRPFVPGVGQKPAGAGFYPSDMSKEEFQKAIADDPAKAKTMKSLYTMVLRDEQGGLVSKPYHEVFPDETQRASALLAEAATYARDPGLKRYLELRAKALLTDNYRESDMAWLDMKDNGIDVIIGPIEIYEDRLFGYKAAYQAYVLIKDKQWTKKLARFIEVLPKLQKSLPVEEKYKAQMPGLDSDIAVYDSVYYSGHCNKGSKTLAINLPNDPVVQMKKGARRLQLKNTLHAKFNQILVPIASVLIEPLQRHHVTFHAFFTNTLFHEIAHGLGVKNTVNQKGPVREAMLEQASTLEEGKADIVGLYLIDTLYSSDELKEGSINDSFVTFFCSIFRSIRFGTSSAHGVANLIRYNFLKEAGAFIRNPQTSLYRIDSQKMRDAMTLLSAKIITLQGNGDYAGAKDLSARYGKMDDQLKKDLARIEQAQIPVDIVFEQGPAVLGL